MKNIDYKKLLLILSAIVATGMILWFAFGSSPRSVAFNNEDAHAIEGEFTVSYGDKTVNVTTPATVDASTDDTLVIKKVLTSEDITGNSIMFYARQSYVNVYVGDVQCIEDSADRSMPYYMTPGSYWHYFRLPSDWEGKELRIEIKADVDRYAGEVPVIYSGYKNAFLYMVAEQGIFSLVMCVPVLVLGIALVAFGLFTSNKKLKDRLIILGLFALATSVWNLLEARITQVFFEDIQAATVVLFSCYYVIPFLAACFLDTYESFHNNKVMRAIMYGTGGIYILLQVLQGASVIRYIDFVSMGHIMIGIVIGGVVVNYVIQRKKNKIVNDSVVYKAIMLLGIFCLVDIFRYHISPLLKTAQFSKIGFLVFFFYLGFSVINQINEAGIIEREREIYKRLAFVDTMTQVFNRTAFEQKIYNMRQSDIVEPTYFYMVDMNNLKKINDTYGHSAGDNAIIDIAKTLKESFEGGECYRIGGDEFCVITEGIPEEKIKEYSQIAHDELNAKSKELEYEINIAVGYSKVDKNGLDDCFNIADELMYKNKAEYKRKVEQNGLH